MTQTSNEQNAAYLIHLAKGYIDKGVIHEPRAFYDVVDIGTAGTEVAGSPGVFRNGEQFPVRLTHMLGSVGYINADDFIDEEINIQRIGLRMVFHNQFYMNPVLLPVPLWGNKAVAAADITSFGTSSWKFDKPFVLSARDTLSVEVQLNDAVNPASGVPVNVSFTGIGMLSHRPYLLNSQVILTDLASTILQPNDFRNDGSEPIIVSDMTLNVGAEVDDPDPTGDIRRVSLNIKQIGNGTNASWFIGPTTPVPISLMPGQLTGQQSGRAVVHRFPGDGLMWEPGEGIDIVAQGLSSHAGSFLNVALLGQIIIT